VREVAFQKEEKDTVSWNRNEAWDASKKFRGESWVEISKEVIQEKEPEGTQQQFTTSLPAIIAFVSSPFRYPWVFKFSWHKFLRSFPCVFDVCAYFVASHSFSSAAIRLASKTKELFDSLDIEGRHVCETRADIEAKEGNGWFKLEGGEDVLCFVRQQNIHHENSLSKKDDISGQRQQQQR
jgi:hypothetical protein